MPSGREPLFIFGNWTGNASVLETFCRSMLGEVCNYSMVKFVSVT